jgi:hypothetical protein
VPPQRKEDFKPRDFGEWMQSILECLGCGLFGLKTASETELHILLLITSLQSTLGEVRVDGAKEFLSKVTRVLCYDLGITLRRTEPYKQAQSGKLRVIAISLIPCFQHG